MAKYAVVETTNLRAVHFAERIMDCVSTEDIENGTLGHFEKLADGYTHVYEFVKGVKAGFPVVIVNTPAWSEDECRWSNQRRDQFINPAGTPFRAFVLHDGDEFGITIEGITAETRNIVTGVTNFVKNDVFVTVDDSGKLKASATATADAIMEGRIERKRRIGATLVTAARDYGYANDMYEVRVKALA